MLVAKNVFFVFIALCAIFLIAVSGSTPENTVVSVHDGDTIYIRIDNKDVKIRLAEIDAPELKQAYGRKSTEVLFKKIYNKQVKLDLGTHKDVHNRPLAKIYLENRYINAEMVKEGYAWDYHQYSHNKELAALQELAKKQKLGLWKDSKPIPPWEFRKMKNFTNRELFRYN